MYFAELPVQTEILQFAASALCLTGFEHSGAFEGVGAAGI
jgi:hypothetical protein